VRLDTGVVPGLVLVLSPAGSEQSAELAATRDKEDMLFGLAGVDDIARKGVLVLEDARVVEVGLEADFAVGVEDDQVGTGDAAGSPVGSAPLELGWKTTSIKVSTGSIRSISFDNNSGTVIIEGLVHLSILSSYRRNSGNLRRFSRESGR